MRRFATALAVTALGLAAGQLNAQACLGNGAFGGQGYLTGAASFTDGAWALSGDLGVNTTGPISGQIGFGHSMLDNSDVAVSSVGGTLAAEIEGLDVSVCPLGFGGYQWLSSEGELTGVDADGIFVGGGLGIGGRIESESGFAFIPAVGASVVHDRATFSFEGVSVTGTDTYGSFAGGFLVGKGHIYLAPAVSITTQDEADPVFTAGLNLVF